MKRLIFFCIFLLLKMDIFQADTGTDDVNSFTLSDEGYYIRKIRYPVKFESYSEFINVFDYDFFTQEREAKTIPTDVIDYIRQGVKSFQTSIAGFHKLKQEFQQKNNHSAVYVEPVHLPNTTLTVPAAAEFSSDTDVNIYNVKLYGLVYINATNMGTSTVDAEYVAQFRVNSESSSEVINLCGQHSLKNSQESLHGSFCYEIVNVTYKVDYAKMRTNTGNVLTRNIDEEIHFHRQNYTDITFSTEMDRWPKLQVVHTDALNKALINHYLPTIGQRFRNVVEQNPDYLIAQEHFVNMYQGRVISTIADLVRLYLKISNQTQNLTTEIDKPLLLENFSKFLYAYSDHDQSADDTLTTEVNVTLYYSEDNSDTIISLQSNRYVVKTITAMLTVRLVNDVDVEELSNVQLSKVAIDLTVNDTTPIDPTSKQYVVSILQNAVKNFIGNVLSDQCTPEEIEIKKNKNKNKNRPQN